MTDDDINKFRGVVKEELKPINEKLGNIKRKVDTLWDQVVKVTEALNEANI